MPWVNRIAAAIAGSLKLKLVLVIVSILGLTMGLAPWSAIKMQEYQLLQAYRSRLRTLHQMLRDTVIDTCTMTGDSDSVQRVIEAISSHQNIDGARIFDTRGVILYSSETAERGTQISVEEMRRYYGHGEPVVATGRRGGQTYTMVQPILNQTECTGCHGWDDKVIGVLQVSLSLESMRRQLGTLRQSALLASVMTLGLIVFGLWVSLTYLVDRPMQQLGEVMERAKLGDLSARAATGKTDEIGRLAQHFNDMISKLQEARREIDRYHLEQLARADRLATIGEMAAAIAHEIRNPLTGISGVLSVLGRDFGDDDPRREVIRQTRSLIERLNKSVEDILVYARPSKPDLQLIEPVVVLDQTLSLIEGEARKARVTVTKAVAFEESGAAERPRVEADPQQLQQVLMNLTLNAVQATPPGGQIQIRVSCSGDRGTPPWVRIEIEDNGKGMTREETEKAFQPFFSSKAEGTGLGLPIAKQIVEQHHGRIELHSTPGKGTSVRIELPAQFRTPDRGA